MISECRTQVVEHRPGLACLTACSCCSASSFLVMWSPPPRSRSAARFWGGHPPAATPLDQAVEKGCGSGRTGGEAGRDGGLGLVRDDEFPVAPRGRRGDDVSQFLGPG